MARVEYSDVVEDRVGVRGGVVVSIKPKVGGSNTLWAAETGSATLPEVRTNVNGIFTVWLDEGRYEVTPTGGVARHVELINEASVGAPAGTSTVREGGVGGTSIAIGPQAVEHLSETKGITAIGAEAFKSIKQAAEPAGWYGVALGSGAGRNTTTGYSNDFIGVEAGAANVSGHYLTILGENALLLSTATSNIVAVGTSACEKMTTGQYSTAVGVLALGEGATPGEYNTAIGAKAMQNATGGCARNIGVGVGACASLEAGATDNVAVGFEALNLLKGAEANTAIGNYALRKATGLSNTAVGEHALFETTGNYNVAVGKNAGRKASTGSRNVFIGRAAGEEATTNEGCVFIGNEAGKTVTTNNVLVIGNSATVTEAWIRGEESGKKLSFYGVAPVARATVNKGSTADELNTALKNLGLIAGT